MITWTGKALCEELIREAKRIGYPSMRLDTIDRLASAIRLYENLGFIDIERYRHNPDPTARFMELKLKDISQQTAAADG